MFALHAKAHSNVHSAQKSALQGRVLCAGKNMARVAHTQRCAILLWMHHANHTDFFCKILFGCIIQSTLVHINLEGIANCLVRCIFHLPPTHQPTSDLPSSGSCRQNSIKGMQIATTTWRYTDKAVSHAGSGALVDQGLVDMWDNTTSSNRRLHKHFPNRSQSKIDDETSARQ